MSTFPFYLTFWFSWLFTGKPWESRKHTAFLGFFIKRVCSVLMKTSLVTRHVTQNYLLYIHTIMTEWFKIKLIFYLILHWKVVFFSASSHYHFCITFLNVKVLRAIFKIIIIFVKFLHINKDHINWFVQLF